MDVAGLLLGAPDRSLGSTHWGGGAPPEIRRQEKDARARGYHRFVRIETAADDDLVSVRIRHPATRPLSPDLLLITTQEPESFPVVFDIIPAEAAAPDGPLSVTDDLPVAPFELALRVPAAWPDHDYQRAVVVVLKRFLRRYRAFQAYGQHIVAWPNLVIAASCCPASA